MLVLSAFYGQAEPLMTSLDQVEWQQKGHVFSCSLTTDVSHFGSVSLVNDAGYEMDVKISSVIYPQALVKTQLGTSEGPWSKKQIPTISWLPATTANNSKLAVRKLLRKMQQGQWGHIKLDYTDQQSVHLVLPTVQRGNSFSDYFQCLSQLAPLSFEHVRDRNFYYDASAFLLNKDQQKQLTDIIRFIELEPSVSRILIDGHADSSGHNSVNLHLSQQRADDLYAYLLEAGIDAKLIEVRSHGDRYPLVSNNDASQRQTNRRVNLRIILKKSS